MALRQPATPKRGAVAAGATPAKTPGANQKAVGSIARVVARSPVARAALTDAAGMPGWRSARVMLGEALTAGDTALFLQARGKTVTLRRRVGDAWQPSGPLAVHDAADTVAALKKLAVPATAGQEEPEYEVGTRAHAPRTCRVATRAATGGDEVLVLLGAEVPDAGRWKFGDWIKVVVTAIVPSFLRRRPAVSTDVVVLPRVALEPIGQDAAARHAAVVESDGYAPACALFAAAVHARAGGIVFESGPKGVTARFDVDGVVGPAQEFDGPTVKAIVAVLQAVSGIDPKLRGRQVGKLTAMVENKAWPCSVVEQRSNTGARVEVAIEQGRPKFKTLSDIGMTAAIADRIQEWLKLESGLIVVAAPPRGGLSTLFDGVVSSADRLLRDFVLLEDASLPRQEIQNVKPFRWDHSAGRKPVDAFDAALREYPHVITTCDLEDSELAQRLVAQAGEGRLVIVGVRADDTAESLTRLLALGVEPQALGRVLLGVVGVRLVRKLCPKCRHEYFPAIELLMNLKIDLDADVTLFRAPPGGCSVCTGTGYLGRTAACELAAGPTLRAYVAKGAQADVLRKAAAKDGMKPIRHDAIAKATQGVTSIEEVQRALRTS